MKLPTKHRKQVYSGSVSDCLRLCFYCQATVHVPASSCIFPKVCYPGFSAIFSNYLNSRLVLPTLAFLNLYLLLITKQRNIWSTSLCIWEGRETWTSGVGRRSCNSTQLSGYCFCVLAITTQKAYACLQPAMRSTTLETDQCADALQHRRSSLQSKQCQDAS